MELSASPLYLLTLLVPCILITGCTGNFILSHNPSSPIITITPVNNSPVVFNESDNGKIYAIPQDTEFWINLTETLATNEPWQVTFSPGLELMDSQYFANPSMPRFDIDGTHRWIFKAKEPGMQIFRGETGWYGKDDPRSQYNISFNVIEKSD